MTRAWLVELADAAALERAVRAARRAGCRGIDTFSPFPVSGIGSELGLGERGMLESGLMGGLALALLTYALQAYTSAVLYPIDVGGRPLHAWPAFLPACIALGLLGAAIGVVARMLARCRLPRLHHPLFETPAFARASSDRFFLLLRDEPGDALLDQLQPLAVHEVEALP